MDGLIMGERAGYFSVGGALGRAFGLFGAEIGKYLLLGALLLSPTLIYALFFAPPPEAAALLLQKGLWNMYKSSFLLGAATLILQMLLQSAVLLGAFKQMQGHGFDLGESLANGIARSPGVLVVSILTGIALIIGFVLLIIPCLIVACGLYVTVPVCVIERSGAFASLSRSWELTSGSRWKIFGLVLLVAIVGMVVGGVITVVAAVGGLKVVAIAHYVWQVISASFGAVLVAVVYHDLRVQSEGIDVGQIASVFD